MFSIFDMYILGGCLCALLCWVLCVWFDKDNRQQTTLPKRSKVFKSWKDIK